MSTKHIATSTLWQIASQVTMAALSILTVKFVAMALTKELAGIYNSGYGYLQLFGILADFGLYAVAVREVSKATDKEKERVLGALILLRCGILVASLLLALAIVWLQPLWRETPLPMAVTIASLVPLFSLSAGIIRTVFQVKYKMQYVFAAEVLQRIFTVSMVGLIIAAGVRGSSDLQILHLLLFIGGLGAFILFFISFIFANKFIRIRIHYDKEMMAKMAKAAAPYGLAFLCMALYRQFDTTMIAILRDDFDIQNAYYGFVLRMVDMGFLIPTFLLNSTLPILSQREEEGQDSSRLLGRTLLTILVLGAISFLFSVFWSRPLVQLLTTDAYLSTATRVGSDTGLFFMSVPIFFNGIVIYSFYILLTKHLWKALLKSLLAGVVFSIAFNLWAIPAYGFVGAAITSGATHLLLTLLLLPQALKAMPVAVHKEDIQRLLTFSVLLGLGLWLWKPILQNEIATVIGLIGATGYMGAVVLLSGLPKSLLGK